MSNVGLSGQVKNEYTPPPVYNKPQENELQKLDWTDKIAQKVNAFVAEKGGSNIVDWILNLGGNLLQAAGLGFVQDFFNKRSMNAQEDANVRAENRANAEYDRRLADMREYNDPSAVSQRLLKAGVNPLSAFVNGGFEHSPSVSAPSPTGVSGQSNSLGGLSGLSNLLQVGSRVSLNDAQTIAALGAESRNVQRFPVELYGLELANALNKFSYDEAVKQAPYILAKLIGDVEYQEQALGNLRKQGDLTDVEIKEHEENILNLQSTRGLIKAQELLALSGVPLNESQRNLFIAQTATEKERTGLVESQKRYSRMECKEFYDVLRARLGSDYYKNITKAESGRLSYELEKAARTLWDKPENSSDWWYFGNLLWNIQNCLTLSASGSVSSSSGSRVVTKK